MLRIIAQTPRMNERNKKRLVGAFVVMTAFVMFVVMALEATRCLFPSLEVEQATEGGTGSKAHQRLLLGALTEEEMAQYRMLPEEKKKVVNRWMDKGFERETLADEMLEIMVNLNLKEENQNLKGELEKCALKSHETQRIVEYLSEVSKRSEPCIPICFREDVRKERLTDHYTKYAEMKSEVFLGAPLIATKWNYGTQCCFSTLEQVGKAAQGCANRENEGAPYANAMRDATNELRDLGDGNDLDAQSRILIIGHGIGYLSFVLQK